MEVIIGTVIMDTATPEDNGIVVERPNDSYTIIISDNPSDESYVMVYGVVNNKTRVIEAFTNALAKARFLAAEFHKDLTQGIDREVENPFAGFLQKVAVDVPPSGGRAN